MTRIENFHNRKRLLIIAILIACPLLSGCSAMRTTGEWTWTACVFTSKYTGCTYLGQKTVDGWNYCFSSDDPSALGEGDLSVWLRLALDKTSYQPGEMTIIAVEFVNLLDRPILIDPAVSGKRISECNIQFIHIPESGGQVLRRSPLVIAHRATLGGELFLEPVRLEPGAAHTEKFAFVNLSEKPGSHQILARYTGHILLVKSEGDAVAGKRPETIPLDSELISREEYVVAGPRLFERRADGLITSEEALRIAHAQFLKEFGKNPSTEGPSAILTETTSELFDYWVTLQKMPEDTAPGEDPKIAYTISPYGGFVREKTAPAAMRPQDFREQQAEASARLKRPPTSVTLQPVNSVQNPQL